MVHTEFLSDVSLEWANVHLDETLREAFASRRSPQQKILAFEDFFGRLESATALEQLDALLQTAMVDLGTARTIEPHLDALIILHEASASPPHRDSAWGVYAAEVPGSGLEATRTKNRSGDNRAGTDAFTLKGTKQWCSLAGSLTHAIVTAHRDGERQAFAIDLASPRVAVDEKPWPSQGLAEIPSGSITCDGVAAAPVGGPNWYFDRPGFAWGGIRVAAAWLGGAIGLAQMAAAAHLRRPRPSPLGDLTFGQLDAQIFSGCSLLVHAATIIEAPENSVEFDGWQLAVRVRNIIYRTAQRIQGLSRELAGPQTMTQNPQFLKTDSDLSVYLSQHHGPRDESALGEMLSKDTA